MPAPQKILFVSHEVEFGGAERSLLELLAHLDREHFHPHLACSGDGPLPDAALDLGITVHNVRMRFEGAVHKAMGLLRAARTLQGLVERNSVALVHTNTLIAGYAGLRAAKATGRPCVWHVRDLSYPWLGRKVARGATWQVANSAATAQMIGGQRVSVIYNGVGTRFFEQKDTRTEIREELGLPHDERIVLMSGRLDPWKGHRVLLEAAARLRGPGVTFLVLGDVVFSQARQRGSYRRVLEARALELGAADRVLFLGARNDVPRWLAGADVLVQPSVEPEPFGRSVAEAQAVGLPVIASKLGGLPELVEHGVDGLLVTPGDSNALASALEQLLTAPERRTDMGRAARAKAQRCWTAQVHAAAVEEVYRRLLGMPRSAQTKTLSVKNAEPEAVS